MVCTCLFKDDIFPIIRFNTHDVTEFRAEANAARARLRRIRGFLGRSDNMVKLRGINVFPQAIARDARGRAGLRRRLRLPRSSATMRATTC